MEKKEEEKQDHEELETLDIKKFFQSGTYKEEKEPIAVPKKKMIIVLLLLNLITLGVYSAIWYIKRSKEFNNLGTKKKLKKTIPSIFLIINLITIFSAVYFMLSISPEQMGTFYQNTTTMQNALLIAFLAGAILEIVLSLFLAFYSRYIINEAIKYNKNSSKKISVFFTLIFGFLYLQYEINRIEDDKEEQPIKAPWIILIILLIWLAGLIFYAVM